MGSNSSEINRTDENERNCVSSCCFVFTSVEVCFTITQTCSEYAAKPIPFDVGTTHFLPAATFKNSLSLITKKKLPNYFLSLGKHHQIVYRFSKKSFPLSSVIINAGKFFTVILRTASIPNSSKSTTSTFKMFSLAKMAAGPPTEPK